jgi:transposase
MGFPAGVGRDFEALERRRMRAASLLAKGLSQSEVARQVGAHRERSHRCRTWAPRGQTPVLQYHFNWKTLSAMAGVTWWNFYFRLFPGAIKSPQVVEFLRHLPNKLLIIWDGLPSHRSHLVWDFVRQQRGRLWLEFLPAYAPELNPVEYLWSHWKQHELPNFCPRTFAQLSAHARRALKRMRQRPTLVMAFWHQSATVSVVSILCGTQ